MPTRSESARSRALVVGSVAFDVVFDVQGTIREKIMFDRGGLSRQNLMFTAKEKRQRFGGTAGNIAYGLGLLGARPILLSAVGKDFYHEYRGHLEKSGVEARVHIEKNGWTAAFYGMSDESKEQIGVWQPNAHDALERISLAEKLGKKDLRDVSVAIFSPGTPASTSQHLGEARSLLGRKAVLIFDPGQTVTLYTKEALEKNLRQADIFIANEIELKQAQAALGYSRGEILKIGPRAVIETRGERGSVLYEKNKTIAVKPVAPKKVAEATGAGDAYRAGLIYGLLKGESLETACRIGSYLGAKNVEQVGGQAYRVREREVAAFIHEKRRP